MAASIATRTEPAPVIVRSETGRIGRSAFVGLVVVSGLTGAPLLGGGVDRQVAIITVTTMLVSLLGAILTVSVPRVFGLERVTAGFAFVASMNVLILMGLPATFDSARDAHSSTASDFATAVLLSYLLVVVSMLWFDAVTPRRPWNTTAIKHSYLPWMVVFGLLVVGAYIVIAWPIPIIEAIRGARESELAGLRANSFALLQPAILRYFFGFVRVILLPFASAALVVRALQRRTLRDWAVAAFVVAIALFAGLANVEKSLVARTLIVIMLAGMLSNRHHERRSRPWLAGGGIALGAFSILFITRQANSASTSLLDLVGALGRRVATLPSEVVFEYFVWTTNHGNARGASIPYFSYLIPGGPISLAAEVYNESFATFPGQFGSAGGAYLGFLWADFGWLGIIGGSIIVALVLTVYERVCRICDGDAVGSALRAIVFVQIAQLPSASLFDSVLAFPFGLVDLTVAVVAWNLLARGGSFVHAPA